MADKTPEPTQKAQPLRIDPEMGKPYKPGDIAIPKHKDVDSLMDRATKGPTREPRSGRAPR